MVPNDSEQNKRFTYVYELLSDQFFFFSDLLDNSIKFFFWSQNNNKWEFDNSLRVKFWK